MISVAYDPTLLTLIVVDGRPASTDADLERAVAAVTKLAEDSNAAGRVGTFVMVVDEDAPAPSAEWRRRFAEAEAKYKRLDMVFVTQSALARGVITAVRWLSGARDGVWHQTQSNFAGAVSALEKHRGTKLPHLNTMYDEARNRSARRAS